MSKPSKPLPTPAEEQAEEQGGVDRVENQPDELDAALDYEAIAERSEADRRAGRVHRHEDVAAWGTRLAAELEARPRTRRRSA
jgi:hypothetical protein